MTDDRDININIDVDGDEDEDEVIRHRLRRIEKHLEELMAVTDTLVSAVATLTTDADAAKARDEANAAAAADAAAAAADATAALQATVDDLNAQIALLTADAVDPAIIAQLEADVAAISGVVNSIAV